MHTHENKTATCGEWEWQQQQIQDFQKHWKKCDFTPCQDAAAAAVGPVFNLELLNREDPTTFLTIQTYVIIQCTGKRENCKRP